MGIFHDKMLRALKIKGYSEDTKKNYLYHMKQFVKFHNIPPDKLGVEDIYAYQVYLIDEKRISFSSFNLTVAAIRFFYNHVMEGKLNIKQLPYQKKGKNYLSFPANRK